MSPGTVFPTKMLTCAPNLSRVFADKDPNASPGGHQNFAQPVRVFTRCSRNLVGNAVPRVIFFFTTGMVIFIYINPCHAE